MKMELQMTMMKRALGMALVLTAGAVLPGLALAQAGDTAPAAPAPLHHSVPATGTVAEADAKLLKVKADRAAVEATFADSERYCYTKFFVNHCLDQAKEIRRAALAEIRPVEIEASHFKRADAVAKRDAALEVDAQKAADEAAARADKPAVVNQVKPVPAPKKASGPTLPQREAARDAKLKRQQATDAANAGKRSASEAAFAQRQADSAKEQARVAKKAAENAEQKRKKAAAKAAADASAAAAAAAASKP